MWWWRWWWWMLGRTSSSLRWLQLLSMIRWYWASGLPLFCFFSMYVQIYYLVVSLVRVISRYLASRVSTTPPVDLTLCSFTALHLPGTGISQSIRRIYYLEPVKSSRMLIDISKGAWWAWKTAFCFRTWPVHREDSGQLCCSSSFEDCRCLSAVPARLDCVVWSWSVEFSRGVMIVNMMGSSVLGFSEGFSSWSCEFICGCCYGTLRVVVSPNHITN